MKKKYLIFGSEGQLGAEFVRLLTLKGIEFYAPAEKHSNITDTGLLKKLISETRPDVVINCAAYNLVDKAEDDKDTAFRVNAAAPAELAGICRDSGAFFVHYSSDYVFDGAKGDLYTEDDLPNPLNVYGHSKLEGEKLVLRISEGCCLVFRTSWVIGRGKQNFLYKLAQWAQKNPVLKISADEVSVPTFTETIAEVTLKALEKGVSGLYHLINSGYASRYELARHYMAKMGFPGVVIPVPLSMFEARAKRPLFAAMKNAKLASDLAIAIPDWRLAMDRHLEAL